MHVGLNLVYLVPGETGGTETYARELIPELVRLAPGARFTAFINRETAAAAGELDWLAGVETMTVPVAASSRGQWVRGEQQLLPLLARRAGVDLVHSLANTGPLWGQFKRVLTVHDIHFKLVPEAHTLPMRLGMSVLVPLAAGRSHRIITDAQSTAWELQKHLGADATAIDVIPLGLGGRSEVSPRPEGELRERLAIGSRPIVLCVAAKRPHKNLIRLISAMSLIPAGRRPLLAIPGYSTHHDQELIAHAQSLNLAEDVRLFSWLEAEDLEGLYAVASCLVCPSLHEGFGLPVLEAMARGLPVACSGRGALAEVAGDAAVLFDPLSPRAIAQAVERLLADRDTAAHLAAAGRERAGHYTWASTAGATLRSYASALT
ncbi:MAG: glycosyltransferase family 1 protein [Actinomycetota bacterium]|nr:glycosyltransferase family 1 protein [Actinomycetota bacterium]